MELFPDGCESYWYNLLSQRPSLFVVCFERDEDEEGEVDLVPAIVTASQDEANAHLESDDPVYSVPMPEKIIEWVERYVVENYEPEVKKKRKRQDWTKGSEDSVVNARHRGVSTDLPRGPRRRGAAAALGRGASAKSLARRRRRTRRGGGANRQTHRKRRLTSANRRTMPPSRTSSRRRY